MIISDYLVAEKIYKIIEIRDHRDRPKKSRNKAIGGSSGSYKNLAVKTIGGSSGSRKSYQKESSEIVGSALSKKKIGDCP